MALSTKIIKKRIRSIASTKKITKAMEMVAAVKMRKSVNQVLASRAFAQTAWEVVSNLAKRIDVNDHQLLNKRSQIKKTAIILITSNRSFCGGFNSQIINKALSFADQDESESQEFIVLGKKGADFLARAGKNIVAEFEKSEMILNAAEIMPIVKMVIKDYTNGVYDKVCVAYTDYISVLSQKPKVLQLLPFNSLKEDTDLGHVNQENKTESILPEALEYVFEPSKEIILDQFLPRLIEIQLYQAMLESVASEHSARMMAMKNASSAATDMIADLTLMFNQARQAGITREIAEICGSKAALE